jgi:CheY-like chemotaxis protein
VILNLFSNASRFTEEGGISIKIFQEDQRIVLTISDTGPGIDSEDAKRVFEPFWQGRSATWQQKGGSGLGLNLSREFVKLHGGQMWFESQPDKGTTFFLYLPISPFLEPIVKPDRYNKDDWIWRESSFKSSQISIDNPTSKPRLILCDETDTLYTRFLHFSDQVEFINLRSLHNINNENSAQALVINVPSVEQLWPQVEKAINETTATPIVGCCIPVEKEQALSSGAIGYLIKPVTLEDLKHAIETVGKPIHRILLVDDDADVLRLFSRMIFTYDKNIEVQTASSGRRALELINQWTPDLLLLDIVMPEMTGWQVLETIQRNPRFAGISTYFVTAQDPTGPLNSAFFFASIKGGISLHKLLQCSLEVSSLLMEPEQGPDLMPE